ncbi:hypothetical protein [Paraburkholderia acidiphila]|uniref:Peptidase M41 domain-containing protein n=1 Tax=Paraburkholderia acidiphila TaxID=2571747 RepID=A0A7Z2G3D4_9BURK|nr:hypothetical protein [Paraburkholderia acidiphila]QGZ54302.1 hypothetical protein FAZ97_04870 [Paraburkholderia acidiphila]
MNLNVIDSTGDFTPAEMRIFQTELIALRAKYGDDPGTSEQAAAHEAGHAILCAALGWRFDESRVTWDGVVWHGATMWKHRLTGKAFRKVDEPDHVFAMAIQDLGGRSGEMFAGSFHPASSVDERCSASFLCLDLDAIAGLPSGTSYKRAEAIAKRAIAANAKTFHEFRARLERQRYVKAKEGRSLLRAVAPITPAPDFRKGAATSGRERQRQSAQRLLTAK